MVSVWLPAFSPFRTMFSKTYIPGVMQTRDCSIDKDKFHTLTLSQTTNLDSSKLKQLADGNFRFYKNDRRLSKRVENTVGKGEIARYEQFLLFPQCFQKACNTDT